jgi:hypothetical protein
VTDIPAAIAIGVVGAATTPFGQMIAKRISGKTLRKVGGGPDRPRISPPITPGPRLVSIPTRPPRRL